MTISTTRLAAALTVLRLWTVVSGDTTERSQPWETDFLLPDDTKPTHYDIYMFPNLDTGNFSGSVVIDLNVSRQKSYLWLHAVDLMISKTILMPKRRTQVQQTQEQQTQELQIQEQQTQEQQTQELQTQEQQTQGASITIHNTFFYKDNSFFVIALKHPIPPGQYKLQFKFTGVLSTGTDGLFIYSYTDSQNAERKLVGTYFEPYQARNALPCFDQPDMKATFTVKMVRPSRLYRALSNMNQVSETANSPSSGLTTVLFNTTPPMSTYLLSFFIIDYDKLPVEHTANGTAMTTYGDDAYIKDLAYAFKLAVAAVNFYSTYFNVAYGLPKLDLVNLPGRPFAGFEGWGLIWFNEIDVTYQHGVSSTYQQYNLVELVEHEIVHMWCGDLVTPTWWNDLFVSEGLAYYLQFAGIDNQYPSWQIYDYLPVYTYSLAMNLDFSVTAMPIVSHVKSIDDGDVVDSDLMYIKAPSVLNMLSDAIGSEKLRLGISNFVKTYAMKNAVTRDLWKQIEKFSNGVNITKFMAPFTEKNGVPLLNVSQVGNTLTLTQSRFMRAMDTCNGSDIVGCVWEIPVTMVGSNNYTSTTPYWFHMDQPTLKITVPKSLTWYKLNRHQVGYYMVQYSRDHWNRLADVLNHRHWEMDPADRANLIYDAFKLAKMGHLPLETAFNMTMYMDKEDYYPAWEFFIGNILGYDNMFANSSIQLFYRRFLLNKVAPQVNDSIFKFDPDSTFFLRKKNKLLVFFACAIGNEFCLTRSKDLFVDCLFNCGCEVSEDIRDVVFATGISQCGVEEWDELWSNYLKEEDSEEKDFLFQTLCYSHDPWIIERLIERAKEEELVSASRYGLLLKNFANNPVALPIIWDYTRSNVQYIIKRAKLTETALATALTNMIGTFNTELRLKELDDLLKIIPIENLGKEDRSRLLNSISYRINFLKQNEDSLRKWFRDATQKTVA